MNIEGSVALVTGGGSGLGRATAERLRDSGARVLVADLGHARESVETAGMDFAATDVTKSSQVEEAISTATAHGPLRVLVNCAGIGAAERTVGKNGPASLEVFERIVTVNLIGTFNVIRLAAAAMQDNGPRDGDRGVIVNTASAAAFDGQVGQAAYSASKGGIVGLTLPVARDLARLAIRCVTIAPGLFDTPLFATVSDEQRRALEATVPHPSRLGHPSEYAAMVAQVIENPMLNGETIRLDGALRMAPR